MEYDCVMYMVHEKRKNGAHMQTYSWAGIAMVRYPSECVTLFSSWLGPEALPALFVEEAPLWADIKNSYFGG